MPHATNKSFVLHTRASDVHVSATIVNRMIDTELIKNVQKLDAVDIF